MGVGLENRARTQGDGVDEASYALKTRTSIEVGQRKRAWRQGDGSDEARYAKD
jgi:hypothetical protein